MTDAELLAPHRLFATTVALLTSRSEAGVANVMACEWTMNVSWRPLKIMSLVHVGDLSHEIISRTGEFGVNLCSTDQAALSHVAGSVSGREYDKLSDPAFAQAVYPAARIRAPMIRGCVLNAECLVEQQLPLGDYTAFIGRAVAVRINPQLTPLIYHRGRYRGLTTPLPRPAAGS